MTTEKSCGAVIYTHINNEIFYVIIKHSGAHHGFPKGHAEKGESETETALREIYEEVGLKVTFANGFREVIIYPLPGKPDTLKQTVYFLAEYENQQIKFDENELDSAELMTFEEALAVLEYEDLRQILHKAHMILSKT